MARHTGNGSRRDRKRPARPYRRSEWIAGIVEYGEQCTAARAWEQKNLAGLYDALADASLADKRERLENSLPFLPNDRVAVPPITRRV